MRKLLHDLKTALIINKAERLLRKRKQAITQKRITEKLQPECMQEYFDVIGQLEALERFKAENKRLKRKIRENSYKVFYVNHLMGFVISDKGLIVQRAKFFPALLFWLEINACLFWARLTGYKLNKEFIDSHFCFYAGIRRASRKSGLSEDILLKPTCEVLAEQQDN